MAKPFKSYSNTSMATVRKVSNCCQIDVKKSTVKGRLNPATMGAFKTSHFE